MVRAEDRGATGMEGPLEMLGTHKQSRGSCDGGVGKEVMRAIAALPSEVFPTQRPCHLGPPSQDHHSSLDPSSSSSSLEQGMPPELLSLHMGVLPLSALAT